MKTAYLALSVLSLGMFLANFGCSTESPGASETPGHCRKPSTSICAWRWQFWIGS